MSYLLEVEFVDGGSEGRLALYRHSLLKEAQTRGAKLLLRAVGSAWDDVAKGPTQRTDVGDSTGFRIVELSSTQLKLQTEDWPDAAPFGELMQFSVGDQGGELYVWTRALSFTVEREPKAITAEVDL